MRTRKPTKKQLSETMRYLSSLGASAGGIARAESLSPQRRSEIARAGAVARWSKWSLTRKSGVYGKK